jgi:hypothetical protein
MGFVIQDRRKAMTDWLHCKTLEDKLDWHIRYTPWMGRDMIFQQLPEVYAEMEKKLIQGELDSKYLLKEESAFEKVCRQYAENQL